MSEYGQITDITSKLLPCRMSSRYAILAGINQRTSMSGIVIDSVPSGVKSVLW